MLAPVWLFLLFQNLQVIDLLYNELRVETQFTIPHQDVYEHATPIANI